MSADEDFYSKEVSEEMEALMQEFEVKYQKMRENGMTIDLSGFSGKGESMFEEFVPMIREPMESAEILRNNKNRMREFLRGKNGKGRR